MERLTRREYGEISCTGREIPCSSFCNKCSQGTGDCEIVKRMVEKLADYEDLEEQGRLLRLPCAIGDTVWNIETGKLEPFFANGFNIRQLQKFVDGINYELLNFKQFGKTVFLTKSEAEAKLKELRGETK